MKKLLIVMLAMILVLSLATGCGGRDKGSSEPADTGAGVEEQEDVPADEPAEEPADEPASDFDPSQPLILEGQGITDEKLAEMVDSGEIPANVKQLDLLNNDFTDLTPLSKLTDLEVLWIGEGAIGDLTPLTKLNNLYRVEIHEAGIGNSELADIVPVLSGIKNLVLLCFEGNDISDPTPLFTMTQLQMLKLKGNPLPQDMIDALESALPDCQIIMD